MIKIGKIKVKNQEPIIKIKICTLENLYHELNRKFKIQEVKSKLGNKWLKTSHNIFDSF